MCMHTNQSKLTESAAIDPVQLVHPADGNMASAMATTTGHGGVASILTQIAHERQRAAPSTVRVLCGAISRFGRTLQHNHRCNVITDSIRSSAVTHRATRAGKKVCEGQSRRMERAGPSACMLGVRWSEPSLSRPAPITQFCP